MTNFIIDIISDPVCPWCYIGKKRLDRAITLYQKVYPSGRHDTFTLNWKAYYLDPSAPVKGISFFERQMQKLLLSSSSSSSSSSPQLQPRSTKEEERLGELAKKQQDRLLEIGRREGIEFSFRGKIGNTKSAHRAILFSKTNGNGNDDAQDGFVNALFAAYFEGEADITSHEDLVNIGASVGLDRAAMLAWLDDGEGGHVVDGEDRAAREMRVRGVPSFTVQGQTLDGAQDVQTFLDLFVRIKEEQR
ncbi:thioredoxin-like protein [Poronia punctata]|nr:thioredoxin-like protein [Poronia punctata]